MEEQRNKVVCPECGKVRLETPPGTTVLPTLGMALKASGAAGKCDCGKAPHERPGAMSHVPGDPTGPGTTPTGPGTTALTSPSPDGSPPMPGTP